MVRLKRIVTFNLVIGTLATPVVDCSLKLNCYNQKTPFMFSLSLTIKAWSGAEPLLPPI